MSNPNLENNKALTENYSGDAFRAGAVENVGVEEADGLVRDAELHPSEQVDYRGVDNGMTSIGATDQNADRSSMSDLGTPGVRIGDDTTTESGNTVRPAETRQRDLSVEPHDDKISEQFNDPARQIEDGVQVPTAPVGTTTTRATTTPVSGGDVTHVSQDTRSIVEKVTDAITGDHIDDKTGARVVDHR